MRDIPELTFRGALGVLGQHDRPVLDRLNTLLGGVIMVGGAVALTGPAAVPLVSLAAVWGWVDQKNEALELIRKLLDKVGDRRGASRGYDRTRLVAAAHTVLVASAVVNAFRVAVHDLGERLAAAEADADGTGLMTQPIRAFAHGRPARFALIFAPQTDPEGRTSKRWPRPVAPVMPAAATLAGEEHAMEAARTITAWVYGFISMELANAFNLGGDIDRTYEFGLSRLADALTTRHPD